MENSNDDAQDYYAYLHPSILKPYTVNPMPTSRELMRMIDIHDTDVPDED